jgi:hypothetical protein
VRQKVPAACAITIVVEPRAEDQIGGCAHECTVHG